MNGEWQIILMSALPIAELRVALPLAILQYHFAPFFALFLSVLGNLLPIALVFYFMPPILCFAEKHIPVLHRVIESYLRSLERKYQSKYHKYGAFFLFLFVAVPFPGTGAWTGSVLAVLFGVKPKASIPAIAGGVLLAGIIVLILTLGYENLY